MRKQFNITCRILIIVLSIAGSYGIYKNRIQVDLHVISNSSNHYIATRLYNKVNDSKHAIYSKDFNNRITSKGSAISVDNPKRLNKSITANAAISQDLKGGYVFGHNKKLNSNTPYAYYFDNTKSINVDLPTKVTKPKIIKPDTQEKQTTEPPKQTTDQGNASIKHDKITCPSVEKVQQESQQINNPFLYDGTYRITSSAPVFKESDIYWIVGVTDIVADSSDEAIEIAKTTASNTNHKKNEYAEALSGPYLTLYMCNYGPGDVGAVAIDWNKTQSTS